MNKEIGNLKLRVSVPEKEKKNMNNLILTIDIRNFIVLPR